MLCQELSWKTFTDGVSHFQYSYKIPSAWQFKVVKSCLSIPPPYLKHSCIFWTCAAIHCLQLTLTGDHCRSTCAWNIDRGYESNWLLQFLMTVARSRNLFSKMQHPLSHFILSSFLTYQWFFRIWIKKVTSSEYTSFTTLTLISLSKVSGLYKILKLRDTNQDLVWALIDLHLHFRICPYNRGLTNHLSISPLFHSLLGVEWKFGHSSWTSV